jgi:hypothetical protein
MHHRYPCGGSNRREFLAGAVTTAAAVPILSGVANADEPRAKPKPAVANVSHHGGPVEPRGKLGAPGLYPGRVVEVRNPAMIKKGVRNREAINTTLATGLTKLTGSPDATAAWRTFFEPGDVVGIKVVPNGQPWSHSSFELVLETIEGLKSAGVKTKDIFVYDRYRGELMQAGYHKILPEGIKWGGLDPVANQFTLDFPDFRDDPIAGFDRDAYVWMDLIPYGSDPKEDHLYRSHIGTLISKVVNKIVAIPVLKDHGSAGITGALKNMSHGSVNNVARSHSNHFTNVCNQFIPQVVTHPLIREKFVLQIMDGIRGVFQGGPFARAEKLTWESNALLLATDPVAMDHVEWDIVDAKRVLEKLPRVGASGKIALDPLGTEGFDVRQPQHVALAGALGMGNFDFKSPRGRRHSIQHQVVSV